MTKRHSRSKAWSRRCKSCSKPAKWCPCCKQGEVSWATTPAASPCITSPGDPDSHSKSTNSSTPRSWNMHREGCLQFTKEGNKEDWMVGRKKVVKLWHFGTSDKTNRSSTFQTVKHDDGQQFNSFLFLRSVFRTFVLTVVFFLIFISPVEHLKLMQWNQKYHYMDEESMLTPWSHKSWYPTFPLQAVLKRGPHTSQWHTLPSYCTQNHTLSNYILQNGPDNLQNPP